MSAAYNAIANFRSIEWHGVDFSIRHNSGGAFFQEFGYSPEYLLTNGYPGTFKLGGFYDSEPLHEFTNNQITGTWMIYGLAQQRLYTVSRDEERRLTGVLGYSYAPPAMNTLEDFASGGLLFKGPLASRRQDAVGFFAIFGEFSGDLRNSERMNHQPVMTNEAVIEINYMYNATLAPCAA
jgi:carbohydrate-selective porin OprB